MARRPRRDARERVVGEALRFLFSPGNAGGRIALLLVVVVVVVGYRYRQRLKMPGGAPAGATVAATNPSGQIRIATWNLRKFSEREGAGQHPPDLVAIARIIKDSGFDLVAIQEVQRQGQVVEKLRRQLNGPWRHAVSQRTGNNERYAFLWRADRVEAIDGPRLYSGPEASSFSRAPVLAGFRSGQFDFTVVSVHLWYGDKANNAQRRTEADALARITRDMAARGPEKDVIVLGDFNETRRDGNLRMFESFGWKRLSLEATNLGSSEAFDNIVVNPGATREVTPRAGVVRFDETVFANDDARAAREVSDHRPVWADFSTMLVDDD